MAFFPFKERQRFNMDRSRSDERGRYDEKTQELIDRCQKEVSMLSPKFMRSIKLLARQAKALEDDALLALVHYSQAQYLYHKDGSVTSYRTPIRKALYHALKADDQNLLTRIHSFIASDALNTGCFDIAYSNYIVALNLSNRIGDMESIALIETNLGRMLAELKDYQEARKYFVKSLSKLKKLKHKLRYVQNTSITLAHNALVNFELNNPDAAEKYIREMDALVNKGSAEMRMELNLALVYLWTRLALERDDKAEIDRLLEPLLQAFRETRQLQDMLGDVTYLYHALMEKGYTQAAYDLLMAVDDSMMHTNVAFVMCSFCELKADYYKAVGDAQKFSEVLQDHLELSSHLRIEQREMCSYAVTLTQLVEDLREERDKVRKENVALNRKARTDALTGIPNRYELNHVLEQSYKQLADTDRKLAISILDIDHFKDFNDNYGHQRGDKCLIQIAQTLDKIARKHGGFCARYGGDEFVMVYSGLEDDVLLHVIREIQKKVEALGIVHEFQSHHGIVTLSQGICNDIPTSPSSPWDFLSAADSALYSIKKGARKGPIDEAYALVRYGERKPGF